MHRNVGLDATQAEVQLVAIESGFRGFEVREAASAPLGEEGAWSERLKTAVDRLGLRPEDSVTISLPAAMVASHVFTLPFTDLKRLEAVLPAEVEGAIPFDLDDVIWDHAVLSQRGGKSEVLVAVVKKALLREHLDQWKAAGVDPRVVTFAPLGLAALSQKRLLDAAIGQTDVVAGQREAPADASAAPNAAPPDKPALILEAGPERANLALVAGESVLLARALVAPGAQAWALSAGDPEAMLRLLGPLVRDVKISLRARGPDLFPTRVLLAGQLALLPGASEFLGSELRLPCAPLTLDAAGRLPAGTLSDADGALPLGLALRGQQPRGHVNFRKGEFAFTKDISKVRGQAARLVAAAVVLLVLWLGMGIARLSALATEAKAYDDALCASTKKILGECVTDYRQAVSRMSGGASKAAGIPRVSGAEVLASVLSHLPENATPLLDDVEVTTTTVHMKGVAESFAQVDQIIASLKADKCFGEIKQPRVEKVRDSTKVQFSFDFPYTCSGEAGGA